MPEKRTEGKPPKKTRRAPPYIKRFLRRLFLSFDTLDQDRFGKNPPCPANSASTPKSQKKSDKRRSI